MSTIDERLRANSEAARERARLAAEKLRQTLENPSGKGGGK